MGTVLVEELGGGVSRESNFPGAGIESKNARLTQLGPYRQDNPPASQAATAQTLGAVDAVAPTELVAFKAGTIVGVVARSNADLTAGTATFSATKGGTIVGTSAVLSDLVQQVVTEFATPVDFVAGDRLGIKLATSVAYAPITADMSSWLMIRWAP